MYLELANSFFIDSEKIAGIFDLDNTTVNRHTVAFLNRARRRGKAVYLGDDIPKSFILTDEGDVIVAQLSPRALKKRLFP